MIYLTIQCKPVGTSCVSSPILCYKKLTRRHKHISEFFCFQSYVVNTFTLVMILLFAKLSHFTSNKKTLTCAVLLYL